MSDHGLDDDTRNSDPDSWNEAGDRSSPNNGTERQIQGDTPLSDFLQGDPAVNQLKATLILFAATGFSLGIIGSALVGQVEAGGFGANLLASLIILITGIVTPVMGVVTGQQIGSAHTDAEPLQVYTLTAIATGVGAIVLFLLGALLSTLGMSSGPGFAELLGFALIIAIATVIAGVAGGYFARNGS